MIDYIDGNLRGVVRLLCIYGLDYIRFLLQQKLSVQFYYNKGATILLEHCLNFNKFNKNNDLRDIGKTVYKPHVYIKLVVRDFVRLELQMN